MWVWSLGQKDPLEEGSATHSSILAWRIPWIEEPGGLQSIGSSVGHKWRDLACMHTLLYLRNTCLNQSQFISYISSRRFIASCLCSDLWFILRHFLYMMWGFLFIIFAHKYPVIPGLFLEKVFLSPLNCFCLKSFAHLCVDLFLYFTFF